MVTLNNPECFTSTRLIKLRWVLWVNYYQRSKGLDEPGHGHLSSNKRLAWLTVEIQIITCRRHSNFVPLRENLEIREG